MDPILLIIKYLFKKKNIDNKDDSIASFFGNGVSFPEFISLIFNVDSISGYKKNPTSLFQKKINNTSALQFLFQNNPKIKVFNPQCENENDQINLLRLILTKQCFTDDLSMILKKSNSITEKFGFKISEKQDLVSLKCFSTLLNIVTNGNFPLSENFAEIVQNHKSLDIKCPLFINENSLTQEYSFIFLIQIQVMFDEYSEEIDQLQKTGDVSDSLQKNFIKEPINANQQMQSQIQNGDKGKQRRRSSAIQDKLNIFQPEPQTAYDNKISTVNNNNITTENILSTSNLQQKPPNETQKSKEDDVIQLKSSAIKDILNISENSKPKSKGINDDKIISDDILSMFNTQSDSQSQNENDDQSNSSIFFDVSEIFNNLETKIDGTEENVNLEIIPPPMLISSIQKIKKEKAEQTKRHSLIFQENQDQLNENKTDQIPKFDPKKLADLLQLDSIQEIVNTKKETDIQATNNRQTLSNNVYNELWNSPSSLFSYDNGILYQKVSNTKHESYNNESNKNLKIFDSDFCPIFIYDEQQNRWNFCSLNFEQFFDKSEQNVVIPLILFIDSNQDSVFEIVKCLKKKKIKSESEENISVFIFQKDSKSIFGQDGEPFFMFVHVPEKKQSIPNIGTILYQIYTFLFLISDLNIVILDKKNKNYQVSFIKNIIEISNFYLNEKENAFIEKANILFLMMNSKLKLKDEKAKIDEMIKPLINKKYQINCINEAKEFIDVYNEIPLSQCYCYSDLQKSLIRAESLFSQISSIYLLYIISAFDFYQELNNAIMEMYSIYSPSMNCNSRNMNVLNECKQFYPNNDKIFLSYIEMVLAKKQIDIGQSYSNEIKAKLNDRSKENLNYLKFKINEKNFWSLKQMVIIKDSHANYLQTQYFEIIKEITNDKFIELFYEKNITILNEQIKKDKDEIDIYFKSFLMNLNKKQTIIENDYKEEARKGTNYVMREVQRMREIEVVIAEGEDLETVIEQDF